MNLAKLDQMIQDVHDGIESPLRAYGMINEVEQFIKKAKKEIGDYAKQEAEKYDTTFEADGFKFELRQGRRVWDFKNCKEWVDTKEQLKDVEKRLKHAYQANSDGLVTLDKETGEIGELPEVKFTEPSLIVKQYTK